MGENFENETVIRNYAFKLPFEANFEPAQAKLWMEQNWTYGFHITAAYVFIIFAGRKLMENRKPFVLRPYLIFWNVCLAGFSISVFLRTFPELLFSIKNYGFHHSVCVPSFLTTDKVASFWSFVFILSKFPELGDTIFIVLRRQPLLFLHWYHHVTVLLYSWYAFKEFTSSARWFIVLNSFIHSLMYSYYALRAMKISVPRIVSLCITLLQICQINVSENKVSSFWTFLFGVFKVIELGDTMFIIMRKKQLITLHWYHHALTMLFGWLAYIEFSSTSRWFMFMNSFIHSFLYTYYTLRILKIKLPKIFPLLLTTFQILQMAVGCYVNYRAFFYRGNGSKTPCNVTLKSLACGTFLYFTFFILFAKLFYNSYISVNKKKIL